MPIQVNNYPIDITAVGATITLPVTDPYDLYTVTTVGTITIVGTTDITTSGVLVEGIKYVFKYTGSLTNPGNLTFMGAGLPDELKDKVCIIEAYYNGTTWEVSFLPDLSQDGVVSGMSVVDIRNIVSYDLTSVSSANIAGIQLLQTVEIPANTFGNAGDSFKVTVWGTTTSNPAELKSLFVKSVTGATTILLFENSNVEDLVGRFQIEVLVVMENMGTGRIFPVGTMTTNVGATASTDTYLPNVTPTGYDWSTTQYINFYGTEGTPSGGQITIRGIKVEKSFIVI